MIRLIEGTVVYKGIGATVVQTGGIGYLIACTPNVLATLTLMSTAKLWTHLAVRDDALDLYGFEDKRDLDLFQKLLTVSGIGPKSALGILTAASADVLIKAVHQHNPDYISRTSSIGKKSAEKIVMGLKDKLDDLAPRSDHPALHEEADAIEAIVSLGYSLRDAREAIGALPHDVVEVGDRIKAALKQLGKK